MNSDMFRKVSLLLLVFVLTVTISVPRADAMTLSEALKRMDAIMAEMVALRAEFSTLTASVGQTTTPAPSVLGAQSTSIFTQSLVYGETNNDIKRIQTLLATDLEIYPYGVASGFFGPKTQEAIRNFQARFGLDTVGVVGPATTQLLSLFIAAYPDGNYPADVLKSKPKVLGAATTNTTTPSTVTTQTASSDNPAESVKAEIDRGEASVVIIFVNGNKRTLSVSGDTESEIITGVASRTVLTEAQIKEVIEFDGDASSKSSSSDADEEDAEDALDDAEDAIDDADDAISDAEDDGDDIDWAEDTLKDAESLFDDAEDAFDDEDYDEAIDLANEAEDMAKKAEDRIDEKEDDQKGDSDDIESIDAEVDDGESDITVEYDDGTKYKFTVEEDKKDDIIDEVADELDVDTDDVEDLIEFDFGDIDSIDVLVDEDAGDARVTVDFESGLRIRFIIDEDDEDSMISDIADELGVRDRDVEDVVRFDY